MVEITYRASRSKPCPVCGSGTKNCSATADGLHLCRGTATPGWRQISPGPDAAGFFHYRRADDDRGRRNGFHNPSPRPASAKDWEPVARGYAARFDTAAQDALSGELGLPPDSFGAIPLLGWNPDDRNAPCWVFPEHDAAGRVVGLSRRFVRRVSIAGGEPTNKASLGRHGLFVPTGWRDRPGDLLIPEGASDTLTLTHCGLAAVGRPSDRGGVDLLAELLAGFDPGRRILVIAENDLKDNGLWPGRDGAVYVARNLAAKLRRPVGWTLPPEDYKDSRAWAHDLVAGAAEAVDWPAVGVEIAEGFRAAAVGGEPVAPPGLEPTGPPPVLASDAGNAYRFRTDHGLDVRYVSVWNSFLVWDGTRWGRDRCREVEHLGKLTVSGLFTEAAAELQRVGPAAGQEGATRETAKAVEYRLNHARRSHSAKSIQAMLALARSDPALALVPEVFDTDPWAFNAANGTIDLRTGRLRPHRREDNLTKLSPTRFDPAAPCPTWERFLDLVFEGDQELVGHVRRLLGYTLTGETTEHALPVLWGTGSNGKSTFVEVLLEVVGTDYSMKAPQNMLLARKTEAHPTEKADLHGMRLVCAVETEEGRRLAESLVKELTGGDRIRARRMKQDFFEFAPSHKLLLVTNHKPSIRGTDTGIWRRLRLIPFAAQFWNPDEPARPGEARPAHLRADKQMKAKLLAEREGILAWLVRGCLEWQAEGLGLPTKVAAATAEYREEENLLGRFLEEKCERDPIYRVRASHLYGAFKTWCQVGGVEDPPSQKSFGTMMAGAGFRRTTSNGVVYLGLRLTNEGE